MPLTFAGAVDRQALVRATDAVVDLVEEPVVADRWDEPSALAGMTVGGLVRHLVSQPECAVEFLALPVPDGTRPTSVLAFFDDADWWGADVDHEANTSIRDEFEAMAQIGSDGCREVLARSRADLPAALERSAGQVYVPWSDCVLDLDDFVVCRLAETVVHVDDLAASLDRPAPAFDPAVVEPVLELLSALAVRRHGPMELLRALSRAERAAASVSAF